MKIINLVAAAATAAVLAGAPAALANVPYANIGSPDGALTTVAVGDELSCQIQHIDDSTGAFYPPSAVPGDCGTFLATGGHLYAPDFASHTSSAARSNITPYTAFTPVSQSPTSGTGTQGDPFRVVTQVDAGSTGLHITQTDSYVKGEEAVRTDIKVTNDGDAAQSAVLYRAADCYLGTDDGYGYLNAAAGAIACAQNPNNEPAARIQQFYPVTGGNHWSESNYSGIWSQIRDMGDFDDDCSLCATQIDNGAGISWTVDVPAHGSVTKSLYLSSSPTGQVGPPPSGQEQQPAGQQTTPPQTTANQDVDLTVDTPKVCIARKARARITSTRKHKLSKDRFGFVRRVKIVKVDFYIDGRRKLTDKKAAFKAVLAMDGMDATKPHELKARVTLQPLRQRGKQVLVGKRFTRTLTTSLKVCGS